MKKSLAFVVPLVIAFLLAGFIPAKRDVPQVDERLQLAIYEVSSAQELQDVFDRIGYSWPPQAESQVPAIEIVSFPQDLSELTDVKQKKALFFSALLPIVLAENEKLADMRSHLKRLLNKGYTSLKESERRWVDAIAKQYRLRDSLDDVRAQKKLLGRVDVVPPALVLAQAANESAWGTSRFAQEGNNLFGQWTFDQSEGLVPLGRPDGATYAVRVFPSLDASVRAYLHNLNTHSAYTSLRQLRREMRDQQKPLDAYQLATGLGAYSERGDEYIKEIQAMMRVNKLGKLLRSVTLERSGKNLTQLLQAVSTAG